MKNNSAILIGGGYSVLDGIKIGLWDKLKYKDVLSLNFAFHFMPFVPSLELWVDDDFHKNHFKLLQQLKCRKVVKYLPYYEDERTPKVPDTKYMAYSRVHHNKIDEGVMYIGEYGLVGTFAISYAIYKGYDNIFLLGYDFGNITNKLDKQNRIYTHWYQDDPKTKNIISNGIGKTFKENGKFTRDKNNRLHMEDFNVFLSYPNKIYNVSPKSNLPYFEKITYERMFELI